MISVLLMIRGFLLNGRHLQVPAVLMSSAQTASRTPLMPFSTPPASLIILPSAQKRLVEELGPEEEVEAALWTRTA